MAGYVSGKVVTCTTNTTGVEVTICKADGTFVGEPVPVRVAMGSVAWWVYSLSVPHNVSYYATALCLYDGCDEGGSTPAAMVLKNQTTALQDMVFSPPCTRAGHTEPVVAGLVVTCKEAKGVTVKIYDRKGNEVAAPQASPVSPTDVDLGPVAWWSYSTPVPKPGWYWAEATCNSCQQVPRRTRLVQVKNNSTATLDTLDFEDSCPPKSAAPARGAAKA